MSKKVESKLKEEVKLEVKPTTNVGLGDTNPSQKLHVDHPKAKVSKEEQPVGHTTRAYRQ